MAQGKKDAPVVGIDAETEAEQAVLGSLLLDPYAHQRVKDSLIVDDFKVPAHRGIWEAMVRVADSGAVIDTVTLSNEMGADALGVCGGVAYLAALAALVPSSHNVEHYARAVRKNSVERGLDRAASLLVLGGGGGELSARIAKAEELLGRARSRIADSAKGHVRLHVLPSMEDVEEEEIDWLWYPYVPFGKITLLEGDPGVKKSWLALAIATHLSRGWSLPGKNHPTLQPGRTLLLAAEDGYGDTVKPRLLGMEADIRMIRPVLGLLREREQEVLTLDAEGVTAVAEEIAAFEPQLVIIDPLIAYTEGVDTNDTGDVRKVLMPLVRLAQQERIAVVSSRHLSKAAGSAIHRGQGNMQYSATARSVLAVARDRENPARSIMAPSKTSLAADGQGVAFSIGAGPRGPSFHWEGAVDASAEEILAPLEDPADRSAMDDAKRFLHDLLFEKPIAAEDIYREARRNGIADRTLRRAKGALGALSCKEKGSGGVWKWELPSAEEKPLGHLGHVGHLTESAAQSQEEGNMANMAKVAKPLPEEDADVAELADMAEFRNGMHTSQNGKSATLPSLPLSDDGEQELY